MHAYPTHVKFSNDKPKRILNFNDIFIIKKIVGEEGFGKVYEVIDKISGKKYALKLLYKFDKDAYAETILLLNLSKINTLKNKVVKYYDSFMYKNKFAILMEYIEGMNALKFFRTQPFGLGDFVTFALWLTNVVNELHKYGYVHRDIKPENIMVTNNQFKLIDFGLACRFTNINMAIKCTTAVGGSYPYIPPEIFNGTYKTNINYYYKKFDVYSIGVTLYYILTNYYPYRLNTNGIIIGKTYYPITTDLPKQLNLELNTLLKNLTNLDVSKRLTAQQGFLQFKNFKNKLNQL